MEADIRWLDDPEVYQVNRRRAHSDHVICRSKEDCVNGIRAYCQSLNGTWGFCYAENAMSRKKDFYRKDFDDRAFDRIEVPGHIELAGYDRIHYINTMYPWEGHEFRRPAYTLGRETLEEGMFSESEYNPVGSYIRYFVPEAELQGRKIMIRFDGVEQAMFVWLNGHFVGYSEDSYSPAEFDLTDYILPGRNKLAVEVHKRSTAAFIEDQDYFRFFGIFRDVTLIARTENHPEDLWIRPHLLEDGSGKVDVQILFEDVTEGASFGYRIISPGGRVLESGEYETAEKCCFTTNTFAKAACWDHKDPALYELEITVRNGNGEITGYVRYPFGFRRIEIRDRVMLLNVKRLSLNGINRHEWSPYTGRAIRGYEMKCDIDIMKQNHINAVRTCHYPNQTIWYSMCDQAGLYVMAEVNLESHGSWQKNGVCEPSYNVPGSISRWRDVVMDRAVSNFEVLKNHTSILFWSLGNESYAGENFRLMNDYYKSVDPERLTHYEGNSWNPDYEDSISDLKSLMYPQPAKIADYLEHAPAKPFICCEFMHSMGNSVGGMGSYMELIDRYEMYQGGFVWDLIDQALYVRDEVTGKRVLRYGGDFDDRPSDYEFSANGLLFADRTEKPAMQEVRYYYEKYSR